MKYFKLVERNKIKYIHVSELTYADIESNEVVLIFRGSDAFRMKLEDDVSMFKYELEIFLRSEGGGILEINTLI